MAGPVLLDCDWCGGPFIPTPRAGGRGHRFCCRRCQDDAYNERRRAVRRRKPQVPPRFGTFPPIPEPVVLGGICLQDGAPDWWASDDPAQQREAVRLCKVCSVRPLCLDWAMHLPGYGGQVIYAGTNRYQRKKMRLAARKTAPA
jgi:hypothetical protein